MPNAAVHGTHDKSTRYAAVARGGLLNWPSCLAVVVVPRRRVPLPRRSFPSSSASCLFASASCVLLPELSLAARDE